MLVLFSYSETHFHSSRQEMQVLCVNEDTRVQQAVVSRKDSGVSVLQSRRDVLDKVFVVAKVSYRELKEEEEEVSECLKR